MKTVTLLFALLSLLTTSLAFTAQHAAAQVPALTADSKAKDAAPDAPVDELGRTTPRGTLKGFMKALSEQKYDIAAEYMDTRALTATERRNKDEYAQDLQKLLDQQGSIPPDGAVSDKPQGDKEDGLDSNMDKVATLGSPADPKPILVKQVRDGNGNPIWLISSDFVKEIPQLADNLQETYADRIMVGDLGTFTVYGAGIGHWILMLGLYVTAFLVSGILVRSLIRLVRRFFRHRNAAKTPSEKHLIDEFQLPLRLYSMVWIAHLSATYIGVAILVRHAFMPISMVIAWAAIGMFFWRLADLIVSLFEKKMAAKERYNMTSALAFARRGLRFLVAIIIIILLLSSFGVDVTAGLAALGIGGIALALGAQKTLENFIGSLSIIADQPFHVGDFCKIGDVSGTVEDIGMRSTRLRTNDRTVVTIPNGDLSTQRIENFARRTRFLINRSFNLRYDSKSDRIRAFLKSCDDVLAAQDKIVQDKGMVRFLGFVDNGHQVQIWANVDTGEYSEYVAIQADIMLKITDAAWEHGLYFSIPSQTFLPAVDQTGHRHDDGAVPAES